VTQKTPEAKAIKAMNAKDLEPLEPYPGGSKPWKCRCLKCGQTVFPRYSSIKRGQGGCIFCAGKVQTTESQAIEIMLSAGLKPIEPYPSARVGWRAQCLNCGKISSPRIDTLKNRKSKCRFCSAKERGLKGRLTQDQALEIARAANLRPLEPYENSQTKWKCECLKCGSIVYPMLTSLKRGQGGCLKCGYAENKRKQLLPEPEAIRFFLSKGFEPLVPYPGANRPWKSKCTKCNEITAPHLNRVRSGTGCGVCAGRIVPEHKAIEYMRNSKLEPLSPYPGGKRPWKSVCKRCNKIVYPKYSDIRNGDGGCKYCGGHFVEPDAAFQVMLVKGVTPQEPYSHNAKKWHCICNSCGRSVYPTWNSVQSGGNACAYCARRKVDPDEAENAMLKHGAKPLEPYPGARAGWNCECITCGRRINPDYSSVVNAGLNPCGYCAGKRVDPKSAFATMVNAGLTPLEDYSRANRPWRCTCNKCKKIVTPTYSSIRIGQGGCRYCTNKGLDYNEPAYLYLMTNEVLAAHKVGVANKKTRANRVNEHKKNGWVIFKTCDFVDGDSAFDVEQKVLLWLRTEKNLSSFCSREQMPQGGYTETVDASEIDLVTIWEMVEKLAKVKL
jgi:hypothetical protein